MSQAFYNLNCENDDLQKNAPQKNKNKENISKHYNFALSVQAILNKLKMKKDAAVDFVFCPLKSPLK